MTPVKNKEIKGIQESEEEFISLLNQKNLQIKLLQKEIKYEKIEQQIKTHSSEILKIEKEFLREVCAEVPTAFWGRNSFEVGLPYVEGFEERNIPTKAKPVQMNKEILEHCKKEIQGFLDKKLIKPSKSPWSCAAFYVNNANEKERGEPRMVINYKPLNKVLRWIRYPLPNK